MFFFIVRSADQMGSEQRINCIAETTETSRLMAAPFRVSHLIIGGHLLHPCTSRLHPTQQWLRRIVGQHMLHGAAVYSRSQ